MSKQHLNKQVFFPPLVLIVGTILLSWFDNDLFEKTVSGINAWILQYFGWLFSCSSFLFLVILIGIYFSPFAKKKIGGVGAQPILTRWKWFAISICTTIATGILFWGCAEPLFHYFSPPEGLGIASQSTDAQVFAMSTMFMHWSFTPYAIYCCLLYTSPSPRVATLSRMPSSA